MSVNKVLWNSEEMDLCIGLSTEMDKEEFIEEARRTHLDLTGELLPVENCTISTEMGGLIWILELNM